MQEDYLGEWDWRKRSRLLDEACHVTGLGVVLKPGALGQLPEWARTLFGSGVVTGTLAAIAAQALAGKTKDAAEG